MANESRGTKRTCQSDDCSAKFYDLNRDPIVCPVCESIYKLAVAPEAVAAVVAAPIVAPAKPAAKPDAPTDGDEIDDTDDALISLEDADAEAGNDDDDEDDNTFLADDDDDDNSGVGDIIGGSVEKDDDDS